MPQIFISALPNKPVVSRRVHKGGIGGGIPFKRHSGTKGPLVSSLGFCRCNTVASSAWAGIIKFASSFTASGAAMDCAPLH